MYYAEAEHVRNDRMGFAVFVAAALHLLLILGLTFEAHPSRNYDRQLKVTLATQPDTTVPEDARHIAQADQAGSGEEAPLYPMPSAMPMSVQPQQVSPAQPDNQRAAVLSSTARSITQIEKQNPDRESKAAKLTGINPEVDRLERQLATLEASLDDQTRAYSDNSRVRRLTSVSAKRAVDAAYLHDWRQRLEAVGNKYYPEASLRYGIYGELRLLVIIRQDGSLEDIRVLSSSGYAVLDEAAMKIVRLAAPFAPFPAELRATTDKLEIIRTWQFQENRLSSG
jgi:protein TonB